MNTRADIVAAIQKAGSLAEQIPLVEALDQFDRNQRQAILDARSIDLADAVITPTMAPVRTFVPHTASTDWLGSDEPSVEYHQPIMAEAALWYGRVSPEVKADVSEFGEQAQGMARRTAGVYGADAEAAEADFLSYVGFLYRREAASGLDQIDQTVAPDGVTNKPTPVPPDVFDTFEDPIHPINQGVSGTETSERNPLIQEIEQAGAGEGQAEIPSQHGGSVALGYLYNMDEFLSAQAASGLDQIQQTTAPDGVTEKPTPIPGEVAFPWLLGGPEVDPEAVPGGSPNEAAPAAGQKEAFLPLLAPLLEAAAPAIAEGVAGAAAGELLSGDKKESALDAKEAATPIYHESYGMVTRPQLAAYRKHNISPSDHDYLADHYGEDNHDAITRAVKDPANHQGGNMFSTYLHAQNQDPYSGFSSFGSQKQADMFGASDAPHAVPQPGVANSPATTPQPQQGGSYTAGFAAGLADAKNGDAATYADANQAGAYSSGYTAGYGKGIGGVKDAQPQSVPGSMGGDNGQSHMTGSVKTANDRKECASCGFSNAYDNSECTNCQKSLSDDLAHAASKTAALTKVSDLFVTAETRKGEDFRKAYKFASKWTAGKRLVKKGSAEFEAGLYAGISDNAPAQSAWVLAHAVQAAKYPDFSERISLHASFSGKVVASQGGDVEGPYIRTESATSTDLDTLAPGTTPSPVGETPINGPGRPGPLAGQADPAASGGPAPYNGAEPFGSPVVPTGVATEPTGTSQLQAPIDDSGNLQSADRTVAFRKRVQANLAATKN